MLQRVLIPVAGTSLARRPGSVVVRVLKDPDEWQCRVIKDLQGRSRRNRVVEETGYSWCAAAKDDTERAGGPLTTLLETQPAGASIDWRVDPDQFQVTVGKECPTVPGALPYMPGTGVQNKPGRARKQRINDPRTRQENDQMIKYVHFRVLNSST